MLALFRFCGCGSLLIGMAAVARAPDRGLAVAWWGLGGVMVACWCLVTMAARGGLMSMKANCFDRDRFEEESPPAFGDGLMVCC